MLSLLTISTAYASAEGYVAKFINQDPYQITTQKIRLQNHDGSIVLEDGRVLKAGTYVINIAYRPGDINPGVIVQYQSHRSFSHWDSLTGINKKMVDNFPAADHIKYVFQDGSVELENKIILTRDQYSLPVQKSGPVKAGVYVRYDRVIRRSIGPSGINNEMVSTVSQVMRVFPNYALLINHDVVPLNKVQIVENCGELVSPLKAN